jgi:ABC-type multidrug transport system ATPase subunit
MVWKRCCVNPHFSCWSCRFEALFRFRVACSVARCLQALGLQYHTDFKLEFLSGGEKRKLSAVIALVCADSVAFLGM